MLGAVSHSKSLTMSAWTGTITAYDSQASTLTVAATDIVRPSNWNSAHSQFVTLGGNVAGQSALSGTNFVLAGGSNVTLSAATAAGAATVTISIGTLPAATTISRLTDFGAEGATLSSVTGGIASLSLRVLDIKAVVSLTRVDIPVFVSVNTTKSSTAAKAISSAFVLYTNNNSTLSPIVGATGQTTVSWVSNTGSFTNITGGRYFSFPISTVLTPGEYFAGFSFSTADSSIGTATRAGVISISMSLQSLAVTSVPHADFGANTANSTNSWFGGIYSNSITATNQTLAQSDFTVTGSQQFLANTPIVFRNY